MKTKTFMKRLLALVLALALALPSNLASLNVQAATAEGAGTQEDPYLLDIKDGLSIGKSVLYSWLVENIGTPGSYNGTLIKWNGFYIHKSTVLQDNIKSSDTGTYTFDNTNVYQVYDKTNRDGTSHSVSGYIQPRTYYAPTITIAGLKNPSEDQVTLNGVNWSDTHKVYAGDSNATFTAVDVEGYTAILKIDGSSIAITGSTEVTINNSNEIVVEYKEVENATVNYTVSKGGSVNDTIVDIPGNDTVQTKLYPDTDGEGVKLSVTATPDATYYVDSITIAEVVKTEEANVEDESNSVTETSIEDEINAVEETNIQEVDVTDVTMYGEGRSFTHEFSLMGGKEYNVRVNFAERKLVLTDKTKLFINGYKSSDLDTSYQKASYKSELTADKFVNYDACEGGKSVGTYTVKMQYSYGLGTAYAVADDLPGTALDTTGSKPVRIEWSGDNRYPMVKADVTCTIEEARKAAPLSHEGGVKAYTADAYDETLENTIKTEIAATVKSNLNKDEAETPTVEYAEGIFPAEGETSTYKYKVKYATDAYFFENDIIVEISITNSEYLSPVTLEEGISSDQLVNGEKYKTGTYSVSATISEDDWKAGNYIKGVEVADGTNEPVVYTEGLYSDNGMFSTSVKINNGSSKEVSYTISPLYEQRTFEINEELTLGYNFVGGETETEFKTRLLKEAVGETATLDDYTVEFIDITYAEFKQNTPYSFKITWEVKDDDKNKWQPVSEEGTFTLTVDKQDVVIKTDIKTKTAVVDGKYDDLLATIKEEIAALNNVHPDRVTVELTNNTSVPAQGVTIEAVSFTVNIAGNDYYNAAEPATLLVDVTGELYPATVKIVTGDNGTTSVTDAEGKTVADGDTFYNNTQLTISAVPGTDKPVYVDTVTVTEVLTNTENGETTTNLINANATWSKTAFTNTFAISDSYGKDANVRKTYTVNVTFAERELKLLDKDIKVNGYSPDTRKDGYLAGVTASNLVDFAGCVGGTATAANFTVKMQSRIGTKTIDEIISYGFGLVWGEILDAPTVSKDIDVTWAGDDRYPEVTATEKYSIVELRENLALEYTGAAQYNIVKDGDDAAIINTIKANIEANAKDVLIEREMLATSDKDAVSLGITVKRDDSTPLPADGKTATVKYNMTYNEDQYSLGDADGFVVDVEVTNDTIPSTITIVDPVDGKTTAAAIKVTAADGTEVSSGNKYETGTYTVEVSPAWADKYYVTGVVVSSPVVDADGNVSTQEVTYAGGTYADEKGVYTVEVPIATGDATEIPFTITATYGQRELKLNEKTLTYNFLAQGTEKAETQEAFEARLIAGVVEGYNVADTEATYTVEYEDTYETIVNGENTFTITLDEVGNVKPAVTKTVKVTLSHEKQNFEINTTEVPATATINESYEEVLEAIKTAIETKNNITVEDGREVTVELVGEPALPTQGNTVKAVEYKVSITENAWYEAADTSVYVDVTGEVNPVLVAVESEGTGTVTVTKADASVTNEEGKNSASWTAGDITIKAEPGTNCYVDSITVNNSDNLAVNQDSGKYSFTETYTLVDAAGEALTEELGYTVHVVFKERTVPVKNPVGSVGYNPSIGTLQIGTYIDETLEPAIFEAIIGSDNVDGIKFEDITIEYYNYTYKKYVDIAGALNINYSGFGSAIDDGALTDNEKIQITVKANGKLPSVVASDITIQLYDSRNESGISIPAELEAFEFASEAEVINYIKSFITKPDDISMDDINIEIVKGALPTTAEMPTEVTYKVSYSGNGTYKGTSVETKLTVTRLTYMCNVSLVANTTETGIVKVNGSKLTADGAMTIDGKTTYAVTVTPATVDGLQSASKWYVSSLVVKDAEGNVLSGKVEYDDKIATVKFTTDGTTKEDSYTIYVDYEQASITLKPGTITYCYDQAKVTAAELKAMIFEQVYASDSLATDLTVKNVLVQYAYVGVLGADLWAEVGENPSINIDGITHKFGEDGEEKIQFTYEDEKYGKVESNEVALTVIDACFNNTLSIVEVPEGHEGKVSISDPKKTYSEVEKYKENTEYTVNVTPGNSALSAYPTKAAYVENIEVTDKDGVNVKVSELTAAEGLIDGVSEAITSASFTTGNDNHYTVKVTYGSAYYETVAEAVTLDMYKAGTGYEAKVPTAEEIFNAVIAGASRDAMKEYDGEKVTVEYSTDGITYKSVDTISNVADGTTVKVRVTYDENNLRYHKVAAFKDVKLLDRRNVSEITYTPVTGEIAFQTEDELRADLLAALAPEVTGVEDAKIVLTVKSVNSEEKTVDVLLSYAGSTTQKPASVEIEGIAIQEIPENATFTVISDKGTVAVNGVIGTEHTVIGTSLMTISATPDKGYAVDSMVVSAEGKEDVYLYLTYDNLTATFQTEDTMASADEIELSKTFRPEERVAYTITVNYIEQKFAFNEERLVALSTKELPTKEDIYKAAVKFPEYDENAVIGVEYLAREADDDYEIYIPKLEAFGIEIYKGGTTTVALKELWLEPGAEIIPVDIDAEVEEIKDKFADISSVQEALSLLNYVKDFIEELPNMHIGAHEFSAGGDGSVEKIRVSYKNGQYDIGKTDTDVTIKDMRIATEITGNDATVSYGFTEDELYKAMNLDVVADGVSIEQKAIFVNRVKGLDASEEAYEITVKYVGDDTYRPCEATFKVTVNKATCSIDYDSQVVVWGTPYKFELVKNPEDVDTINFMIGLDLAGITAEDLVPGGFIQVQLPGALGGLFEAEVNLEEFIEILEDLAASSGDTLEAFGVSADTIGKLVNSIESVLGNMQDYTDITVKINGEFKPENIGIYLAGAVTSDSNYETAYTVDYLIVRPNATEATLEYHFEDENGIITKNIIADGTYDFGATAFVDGVKSEEATEAIDHLFLKADTDGNITLNKVDGNENLDPAVLSQTGAYTQVSYILEMGNDVYYAIPIIRPYVVVPQLVNVDIVDEEGNSIETAEFTFDGTRKEVYAVATDNNGNEMPEELLTINYFGYSLNNPTELYKSTVPPVDAGVYTAVAVYADLDAEAFGMDAVPMVIEAADSSIKVESKSVLYSEYDKTFGAVVSPEDCKYITMIAGIDASGDFITEGLNAFTGAVNIDFPTRVDNVLKTVMPSAYEGGISVNDILTQLELVEERLAELGLDEYGINIVTDFLSQIPVTEAGDVKVTFHEYADAAPTNVGLYLLGAVTCDPNYEVHSDFGYLALIPDTTEVDLAFNIEDDNIFVTSTAIDNGDYDLGSHVVRDGSLSDEDYNEAEAGLTNLYIGVNAEDGTLFKSTAPTSDFGLYNQIAFILDSGNQIYYAEPISRTYVVVPEVVDIEFTDDTEVYTFDGQPHGKDAKAFTKSGEELPGENLTVYYVGYDANDIVIYTGTEAPTNAGVYQAVAVYVDVEGEQYGAKATTFAIKPAEASIEIESQVVNYADYDGSFKAVVTPEDCKYITMIAGIDASGDFINEGLNAMTGAINIDFPTRIDKVLKTVLPSAYEGGVNAEEIAAPLEELQAELAELGLDSKAHEAVIDYINQLQGTLGDVKVTFNEYEDAQPENIGIYLLGAVTCDPNYEIDTDFGVLALVPDATEVELAFNVEDDNIFVTSTYIDNGEYDLGSHVVRDGKLSEEAYDDAENGLVNLYVGATSDGKLYKSTVPTSGFGAYTQVAFILDDGNQIYYARPIVRGYVVVPEMVDVKFENDDNLRKFTYDGEAHGMDASAFTKAGEALPEENLTVRYIGYDANDIAIYYSEEKPVNVGSYKVIATYIDHEGEQYGMNIGQMVIAPAEVSVEIDSQVVNYAEYDGSFGAVVTPEDCKYITMIAGVDASGNFLTEGLNATTGAINIDFPERVDKVLKKVLPEAYEEGICANDILLPLEEIQEQLAELGLDAETIDVVIDYIYQIPAVSLGDTKVTFHEYADAQPENVGLYILGAVTCDPNYALAADFGYLALVPETVKVDLGFNVELEELFIPSTFIENGIIDLGVYVEAETEEMTAEAYEDLTNLYIGINEDLTLYMETEPSSAYGVYQQIAYILDEGNRIYYAEPIAREYVVVPELVDIHFADDKVKVELTYNGYPQGMNAYAVDQLGNELSNENLELHYFGYDADGIAIYSSTTPPTNVGIYGVVATYIDHAGEQYGLNVGELVIKPAEPTVEVGTMTVEEGDEYEFDIKATGVEIDGVKEDVNYITVVTAFSGDYTVNGVENAVNIDLPEAIDKILKKLIPSAYSEGISLAELENYKDQLEEVLSGAGFDASLVDTLLKMIGDKKAVFGDMPEAKPTEVGTYIVGALALDTNYLSIAYDYAFLTIMEKVEVIETQEVELTFNDDSLTEIEVGEVEYFDFGATGTVIETGEVIDEEYIEYLYIGIIEETGDVYASTEAPTEPGEYTQSVNLVANEYYEAEGIEREFTIVGVEEKVDTTLTIEAKDVVYDGEAHAAKATLKDADENIVKRAKITYEYVAVDESGVEIYRDSVAPTQAGKYTVTATYAGNDKYEASEATAEFTIEKAELTVSIADVAKKIGEADPEFTCEVKGIVEGDEVTFTLVREEGEEVGTYAITVESIDNANYKVTEGAEGTLTINKREITVTMLDASKTEEQEDPVLEYTVSGDELLEGDVLKVTPVREEGEEVGTYEITATVEYDDSHYDVEIVPATFTIYEIERVDTTINVTVPKDAVYDGKAHGVEVSLSAKDKEFAGDVIIIYIDKDGNEDTEAPVNAGEYTALIQFAGDKYHNSAKVEVPFVINAKDVLVDILDAEKVYGNKDPEFQYTAEGLVGEEVLDLTITREANEAVGTYVLDVTEESKKADSNYDVTVTTGTLTITKRTLTVTLDASEKVYGEEDPEFTYTIDGMVDGDKAPEVEITRAEGEKVGTYTITAEVKYDNVNYDLIVVENVLTIAPKAGMVNVTNNVDDWAEWEENLYTGEGKFAIVAIERENYYGVTNEQPVISGYLFSGWFEDLECTTPYKGTSGTYYAKFVDEKVLTVVAQASIGIKDSDAGKLRFITTVDSANYSNVGYRISYNGSEPKVVELDRVFKKFYARLTDGSKKYYEVYDVTKSEASKYFVAYTIKNIPQSAHNAPFAVTPYWTTLDGTVVVGNEHIKVISNAPGYNN